MSQPATISEFSNLLVERQTTAAELVQTRLDEIQRVNEQWNIFSNLLNERAFQAAAASDERREKKSLLGPLDGVPIAIKDNLHIQGFPTFAGTGHDFSKNFSDTASVVSRLESSGAILIGKCNMDEGALGASTNNPFFGQCHNPKHPGTTPGGSSGGSAAAVAAKFVAASLGTDTMGSVRIPAAYCELWGMKPGNGLVDSNGLVPLSPTLDCIGPLAHNAKDLRLMLAAMTNTTGVGTTGADTKEQQSIGGLSDLRIGVIGGEFLSGVEADMLSAYELLMQKLTNAGCLIEPAGLEHWNPGQLRRDGLLLSEVQASSALSGPLKDNPQHFSNLFRKLMAYGESITAERLEQSRARMNEARTATLASLKKYHVLLMPTAPQLAFPVENDAPANQADFSALANVAGCPAVTFPIPIPGNTRKASAQILGQPGSDFSLLSIAEMLQPES